ncbi:MAG: hypothetical protein GXZ14_00895 [Ruminococcaceae bacterium]|nr:hypothetical protein [Oscillospiraceae bacterium]
MKYHKGQRFGLSECRQSAIFWQLRDFAALSVKKRDGVRQICDTLGGIYAPVLLRCLTTNETMDAMSAQSQGTSAPIDCAQLYRLCKMAYVEIDRIL